MEGKREREEGRGGKGMEGRGRERRGERGGERGRKGGEGKGRKGEEGRGGERGERRDVGQGASEVCPLLILSMEGYGAADREGSGSP